METDQTQKAVENFLQSLYKIRSELASVLNTVGNSDLNDVQMFRITMELNKTISILEFYKA